MLIIVLPDDKPSLSGRVDRKARRPVARHRAARRLPDNGRYGNATEVVTAIHGDHRQAE